MASYGAGQWYWYSDSGWVPFADALNAEIEKGFKSKVARVQVDNERFVDLQQLLQRRYDDENKCRMVKREIRPPFDGCIVALFGNFSRPESDIIKLISDNGGLVAQFITPQVTVAICGNNPPQSQVSEAQQLGLAVATEAILDEIAIHGAKGVDVSRFALPAGATIKAAPLTSAPSILVDKGTKWSGVCTDSAGVMVPVELVVTMRHTMSGAFLGELKRPTMKNLKTRAKGSVHGSSLRLEELSIISGGASGKLPNFPTTFVGSLSDRQIKLSTGDPNPITLELTLVPAARGPSKTPLPMIVSGAVLQGKLTQTNQIELELNDVPSLQGRVVIDGEPFLASSVSDNAASVSFSHDYDGTRMEYHLNVATDSAGRKSLRGTRTEEGSTAQVVIDL